MPSPLDQAAEARAATAKLEEVTNLAIEKVVSSYLTSYAKFVGAVLRNNPTAAPGTVLVREDIVKDWNSRSVKLKAALKVILDNAHAKASTLGAQSAVHLMSELGFEVNESESSTASYVGPVLESLDKMIPEIKARMDSRILLEIAKGKPQEGTANAFLAEGMMRHAATQVAVSDASKTLVWRATLGADSLIQRSFSESAVSTYTSGGDDVNLMWVACFVDNVPCPVCVRLHGTVVVPGTKFHVKGHKAFVDLAAPPAHPNCKCRLVPVKAPPTKKDDPAPEASESLTIASATIRNMPAPRLARLLAGLRASLKALRSGRRS